MVLGLFCAIALAAPCAAASASSASHAVDLLTLHAQEGKRVTARVRRHPVKVTVNEDAALAATYRGGGLWVGAATGNPTYIRYIRRVMSPNGDWSFIGKVDTIHGPLPAVITFSEHATYGYIPQADGHALMLETDRQGTWLQTVHQATALPAPLGSSLSGIRPPASAAATRATIEAASSPSVQPPSTASPGETMIDVLVGYRDSLVDKLGSKANVLARIHYLVAFTNAAFANSRVPLVLRLVGTKEVAYGQATTIYDTWLNLAYSDNASLEPFRQARDRYGADIAVLVTPFQYLIPADDEGTYYVNDACTAAYALGSHFLPSSDVFQAAFNSMAAREFAVVGDGADGANGYYCEDRTFSYAVGVLLGLSDDADPDNPTDSMLEYAHGYRKNTSFGGFATIMSAADSTDERIPVFSTPLVRLCQGQPCGVANQADNARALKQYGYWVAGFRYTRTAPYGVNQDNTSDVLWFSASQNRLVTWPIVGASRESAASYTAPAGMSPLATGDFNDDGYEDIVWGSAGRKLAIWLGTQDGYAHKAFRSYNAGGWLLVGTGDMNGDGNSDLVWYNQSQAKLAFWFMSGANLVGTKTIRNGNSHYKVMAIGDFNGDGLQDILWGSDKRRLVIWENAINWQVWDPTTGTYHDQLGFTAHYVRYYAAGGWKLKAVGDIDDDGTDDLLWYNKNKGQFVYWLMDEDAMKATRAFGTNRDYDIIATGDFNGDHHVDILWGNSSHHLVTWLGKGTGFASYSSRNYSSGDWHGINWRGVTGADTAP